MNGTRRLFSCALIGALLVGMLPALPCPMASVPESAAGSAHAQHESAPSSERTSGQQGDGSSPQSCMMAAHCQMPGLARRAPIAQQLFATPTAPPSFALLTYAAPPLPALTPPPRA